MLTIRAAKNPAYYEQEEFARDDYYTERGSVPGRWVGRSAKTLALAGAPERGQLGTLLEGKSPVTGEKLPGGRGRQPSNAGFDLTFTAPKSVSVLLAVGDEGVRNAVLDAQDRATMAGLDYLERHECFARRGTDGVNVIPAQGFVGGAFTHEMARSGDPHLHTHVVIANRVRSGDGRWTAPDMRPVYAAAKTAGTIAEAVLRDELTKSLGVRWRSVVNGTAEIDGLPRGVLEHFSQRHAEITELALTRGWTTERGIAEIQRETRDRKPQLDREVAQARWRARAAEHGFPERDIAKVTGKPGRRRNARSERELSEHLAGSGGLTLQESTFTRRDVVRAIAEAHQEGMPATSLAKAADGFLVAHGVPVSARDGHEPARYTTVDMLATEARLIEIATAKVRRPITVTRRVIDRVINRSSLGEDQAAAARHLTSGAWRTRLLEARAGYGKTTALAVVREAYEAGGVTVLGTSWQGQAAQELQRGAGIASQTAARLLDQIERGNEPIPRRAVLIVDEAGMMPTRSLARLAEEVVRRDGRLILVGDRYQLPSIDAGGAFASLGDRLGVARLEENRRQRDELQRTVADRLAEGKAGEALALLTENGRFTTYNDSRWARANLIDDWTQTSLRTPERALILAHDRRDVAELNKLARDVRDYEGLLGKPRLTAYGREWAVGDRMLCRRNDYRSDVDVRNGTRATVTRVDRVRSTVTIHTDDGRDVRLPPDYLKHVDYGYASTGHASQGATVDRTYLLATPDRGGREWGYVAGSRQRIDLRVYAVHHDRAVAQAELQKTWQRSQAKTLAIDRLTPERLDDVAPRIEEVRAPIETPQLPLRSEPRAAPAVSEAGQDPVRPVEAAPDVVLDGRERDRLQYEREQAPRKRTRRASPQPEPSEPPQRGSEQTDEPGQPRHEPEPDSRRREQSPPEPRQAPQPKPQDPIEEARQRDRLQYEREQAKRSRPKRRRR